MRTPARGSRESGLGLVAPAVRRGWLLFFRWLGGGGVVLGRWDRPVVGGLLGVHCARSNGGVIDRVGEKGQ